MIPTCGSSSAQTLQRLASSVISWHKPGPAVRSYSVAAVDLRVSVLRWSFHTVDHQYFDGTACRFQPQSQLLFERSEEGWSFGSRIRERIRGELNVCFEEA